MEEKKFDFNSLIGFVLLGAIMLWWMWSNQPTPEEIAAEEKAAIEKVEAAEAATNTANFNNANENLLQSTDSLAIARAKSELGSFGYSTAISNGETILENNVLKLTISNKGGQIKEALIKKYKPVITNLLSTHDNLEGLDVIWWFYQWQIDCGLLEKIHDEFKAVVLKGLNSPQGWRSNGQTAYLDIIFKYSDEAKKANTKFNAKYF